MLALQGDAEDRGAMFAFHSPVKQGRVVDGGIEIEVGGTEPMNLRCRLVVNSAGLHAPALAQKIAGMPSDRVPPRITPKETISPWPDARPSRA